MEAALAQSWARFKHHVKHYERFFDFGEQDETRGAMLAPIAGLLEELADVVQAGETLWRARRDPGRAIPDDRLEEAMGPAPVQKASHSRMSPQGISYMYLSDGPATCIAEIRPAAGEVVYMARFRTIRDLRVVDLSGVGPRKRGDEARAARFLASFAREISRPLAPQDALLDYIPTQVLSEFIRRRGYDGIKYRSSQFESGFNYTMFCGPKAADNPADTRVIDPFTQWMRLEHVERKRVCSLEFVLVDEEPAAPLSAAR